MKKILFYSTTEILSLPPYTGVDWPDGIKENVFIVYRKYNLLNKTGQL